MTDPTKQVKQGETKWIVQPNNRPFPYTRFDVVRYSKGSSVSGGPYIATFHEEIMAQEYCDFKNTQQQLKG